MGWGKEGPPSHLGLLWDHGLELPPSEQWEPQGPGALMWIRPQPALLCVPGGVASLPESGPGRDVALTWHLSSVSTEFRNAGGLPLTFGRMSVCKGTKVGIIFT